MKQRIVANIHQFLNEETNNLIDELIQEHAYGRAAVQKLVITSDAYHKGDTKALPFVVMCMRKLVDFYPGHIAREDKIFFPSVMAYFSDSEQQSMLDEFSGFDKKILHLKYIAVVEFFEGRGRPSVAPAAVV